MIEILHYLCREWDAGMFVVMVWPLYVMVDVPPSMFAIAVS